ncbi:MAG: ribosome biogenesis GTPase Der [Saprospiraceae bacterium]
MGNIVAIVGRPNVGKSTLYNRLIGEREAIIDDVSGVTRDRKYGTCEWNGKKFTVIDTGGFVEGSEDIFESAIRSQVSIAIEEASVIVFMTDVTTGITDLDGEVAQMLRKTDKKVLLVVNKVDNSQRQFEANEFWSMGFEDTYFLSSLTGSGSGDLLDVITDNVENYVPLDTEIPKFAILGQPNVGKSSLVNALLGEDRNIVTNIAGTTRDSIHTHYKKFDKEFFIIDTAGMRKKAKVHENLEFYSVMRAIKAMDEADVCFIMVDAVDGLEMQDLSIFSLAVKRNKGIVVLVNKWDLANKETNTARDFENELKNRLSPFNDVPVVFISALEKQRIFKAVDKGLEVFENRKRKIKTSILNDTMGDIIEKNPPPSHRGKFIKIKYITQLPVYYPAFAFFCNYPKHVKESYRNFIENQLRKHFDFEGVPVSVFFRKK